MTFSPKAIFQPSDCYEGVRPINFYLLRLLYILMFFVLGKDTWTHILTHQGPWDPTNKRRSLVRLDRLRYPGGPGNYSSLENATDDTSRNFL
jgi:hypothetical protein